MLRLLSARMNRVCMFDYNVKTKECLHGPEHEVDCVLNYVILAPGKKVQLCLVALNMQPKNLPSALSGVKYYWILYRPVYLDPLFRRPVTVCTWWRRFREVGVSVSVRS